MVVLWSSLRSLAAALLAANLRWASSSYERNVDGVATRRASWTSSTDRLGSVGSTPSTRALACREEMAMRRRKLSPAICLNDLMTVVALIQRSWETEEVGEER